jgi:prepilin-type N-terminal cleavage/methylation domain-containing protein
MISNAKSVFWKSGFSVVEVVVTLVLMAMVMGGAYLVISRAAELSRAARNHYVAATLCKNRLERARNFDYQDLHLMAETDLVVDDNGAPSSKGFFARTTTINTNIAPGLTEVKVTVKVKNKKTGGFGPGKEELSTLFTEYLAPP